MKTRWVISRICFFFFHNVVVMIIVITVVTEREVITKTSHLINFSFFSKIQISKAAVVIWEQVFMYFFLFNSSC